MKMFGANCVDVAGTEEKKTKALTFQGHFHR
jgi:hypothetical protein